MKPFIINKMKKTSRTPVPCKQCGSIIYMKPSDLKRKSFCSMECRNQSYRGGKSLRPLCTKDGSFAIESKQGVLYKVDETDTELARRAWQTDKDGYARTKIDGKEWHMHRLILARSGANIKGRLCDHRNRDRTDNRRSNLRLVSPAQNQYNRAKPRNGRTSIYKGVSRAMADRQWNAYITVNHRPVRIGGFPEEREAAYMYDQWALELHGEFAVLNVVNE